MNATDLKRTGRRAPARRAEEEGRRKNGKKGGGQNECIGPGTVRRYEATTADVIHLFSSVTGRKNVRAASWLMPVLP